MTGITVVCNSSDVSGETEAKGWVVKYRSVRYIFYVVVKIFNLHFRTHINLVCSLELKEIYEICGKNPYKIVFIVVSSILRLFIKEWREEGWTWKGETGRGRIEEF
jgi:hypothetical protein